VWSRRIVTHPDRRCLWLAGPRHVSVRAGGQDSGSVIGQDSGSVMEPGNFPLVRSTGVTVTPAWRR
jgi:hypothetical protein